MKAAKLHLCLLLTLTNHLNGILALPSFVSLSKRSEIGSFDAFGDLFPHDGVDSTTGGFDKSPTDSTDGEPVDDSPSKGGQDGTVDDVNGVGDTKGDTKFEMDGMTVEHNEASGTTTCDMDGLCKAARRRDLLRRVPGGCNIFPGDKALQSPEIKDFNDARAVMDKAKVTMNKAKLDFTHEEILERLDRVWDKEKVLKLQHAHGKSSIRNEFDGANPANMATDNLESPKLEFHIKSPDNLKDLDISYLLYDGKAWEVIKVGSKDVINAYQRGLDGVKDLDKQLAYQAKWAKNVGFDPDAVFTTTKGKIEPPQPDSGIPQAQSPGDVGFGDGVDLSDIPSADGLKDKSPLISAPLRELFPDSPEMQGQVEANIGSAKGKVFSETKKLFDAKSTDWVRKGRRGERAMERRYGLREGQLEGAFTRAGTQTVEVPIEGQKAPMELKQVGNKLIAKNVPWTKGEKVAVSTITGGALAGIVLQELHDNGIF